jgi:hypothetical protein
VTRFLRYVALCGALILPACSGGDSGEDVAPLPKQTAETANALMNEAEQAASNAANRAATAGTAARSGQAEANEVTR